MQQQEPDRLVGGRGAAQLGAVGRQDPAQLVLGRGRVDDAEVAGGDGGLGDVLVTLGPDQRPVAVAVVGHEEAVDLGRVHPAEQVRVVGGVRRAVGHRAGDRLVRALHRPDDLEGVLLGAEGRHRDVGRDLGQAAPHVAAVARVVGHPLHRGGVQRLQHDRPDPADEHRGVAVHAGDGGVGREPARAGGAVHPLACLVAVGAGHLAEQLGAESVAEVHVAEASQGAQRRRSGFDFEYSKFLASMT